MCMEIERINWKNNSVETKHKETQRTTQTKMGRYNKVRSEDIGSKERRRNCKRQGQIEAIFCYGDWP